MRARVLHSLSEIDAPAWNRLNPSGNPFLRHEFLHALEESGCAQPESGWHPQHLLIEDGGVPIAAMPLYLRDDSWGEFVFDWGWAQAYHQAGRDYYPKLTAAVPFTPATGSRLLTDPQADAEPLRAALLQAARQLADELQASSLHVLFPLAEELPSLEQAGLLLREDCQFHWHNRGYADFEELLGTFSSAKRKKARRERKRVEEEGIHHRFLHGGDMTAQLWRTVFALTAQPFLLRGRVPYLTVDFFERISASMGEQIVVVLAEQRGSPVAAAICLRSPTTLYGRYWGSQEHFHSLHFETCYYQGIDYCIREGLSRFEPGTQGEHKIARGFVPEATWSAHWLAEPGLRPALAAFLSRERQQVRSYRDEASLHTPYRRDI